MKGHSWQSEPVGKLRDKHPICQDKNSHFYQTYENLLSTVCFICYSEGFYVFQTLL